MSSMLRIHRVSALTLVLLWAALPAEAQPPPLEFYTVHFANVSLSGGVQVSNDVQEGACRGDAEDCILRGRLNAAQVVEYLCDLEEAPRNYRPAILFPCPDLTEDWMLVVWDRDLEEQVDCRELVFENRPAVYGQDNRGNLKEVRILSDTSINDPPVVADLSLSSTLRLAELPRKLKEVLYGEGGDEMEGPLCLSSMRGNSVVGSLEIDLGGGMSSLIEDAADGRVVLDRGRVSAGRAFDLLIEVE